MYKFHELKTTQKLSAGRTGYHSANAVVLTRDISPVFDNIDLAAILDQSHANQLLATICHMTKTKIILG